jgi:hypothetical protein
MCRLGLPGRDTRRRICRHTQRMSDFTPEHSAEGDLVQVGDVEVDPVFLAGPGETLSSLLAGRDIDGLPGGKCPKGLPADGWRVIRAWPERGALGRSEVLAAPVDGYRDAFAVITLYERNGKLVASYDANPVAAHPGKAIRRQDLRLQWRDQVLRARARQPLNLTIDLVNTSWRPWHNVADDGQFVMGWLLDPDGNRVRAGPFSYSRSHQNLPCLRSDELVKLPVHIVIPDAATLPAGSYGLAATLQDLDLRSDRATLILS